MIHGTTQPKIIIGSRTIDFNIGDESKLILQKEYDYQVRDGKLRKSILTGDRKYKYKGDYAEFKLTVLCPGILSTDDFSTHFAEVQYNLKEGAEVTLYPHADGSFNVTCFVTEFSPFYYKNSYRHDAYIVSFKSKSYKSFSWNQTATPVADPASCSFADNQNVSLSCVTANSVIYYTTDESTPTKDSTKYLGISLNFTQTTTLKAIAYSPSARWSEVMSETYTKNPEA